MSSHAYINFTTNYYTDSLYVSGVLYHPNGITDSNVDEIKISVQNAKYAYSYTLTLANSLYSLPTLSNTSSTQKYGEFQALLVSSGTPQSAYLVKGINNVKVDLIKYTGTIANVLATSSKALRYFPSVMVDPIRATIDTPERVSNNVIMGTFALPTCTLTSITLTTDQSPTPTIVLYNGNTTNFAHINNTVGIYRIPFGSLVTSTLTANSVTATFLRHDGVTYSVTKDIYYDTTAPKINNVSVIDGNNIKVVFNKEIDLISMQDLTNYAITSVSAFDTKALTINSIEASVTYAILNTSWQVPGLQYYQLTCNNLTDTAYNLIAPNTIKLFAGANPDNSVFNDMNESLPSTYKKANADPRTNTQIYLRALAEQLLEAVDESQSITDDNYLSFKTLDETVVRGVGDRDRLVNKGVFEIVRIYDTILTKDITNTTFTQEVLDRYNANNPFLLAADVLANTYPPVVQPPIFTVYDVKLVEGTPITPVVLDALQAAYAASPKEIINKYIDVYNYVYNPALYNLVSYNQATEYITNISDNTIEVTNEPVVDIIEIYNQTQQKAYTVDSYYDHIIKLTSDSNPLLTDTVRVIYEWGADTVDWSKSYAIPSGTTYKVAYKSGARLNALYPNFGAMIDISQGSMTREQYRQVLIGLIKAYISGPTVQSIKEFVEIFTKQEPRVRELKDEWAEYDRDYLWIPEPVSTGTIEYKACKFNNGIVLGNDLVLQYSALANFSLKEGTLSFWIIPLWDSADTDAHYYVDIVGTDSTHNHISMLRDTDKYLKFNVWDKDGVEHQCFVDASTWVRGQTYYVAFTWNLNNALYVTPSTLDSMSVYVFDATGIKNQDTISETISVDRISNWMNIGSDVNGNNKANSIMEELKIMSIAEPLTCDPLTEHISLTKDWEKTTEWQMPPTVVLSPDQTDDKYTLYYTLLLVHFNNSIKAELLENINIGNEFIFVDGMFNTKGISFNVRPLVVPTKAIIFYDRGTIEFWVKPQWSTSDNKLHCFIDIANVDGNFMSIYKGADNYMHFNIKGGVEYYDLSVRLGQLAWTTDQWHLIGVDWYLGHTTSSDKMHLNVDGIEVGTIKGGMGWKVGAGHKVGDIPTPYALNTRGVIRANINIGQSPLAMWVGGDHTEDINQSANAVMDELRVLRVTRTPESVGDFNGFWADYTRDYSSPYNVLNDEGYLRKGEFHSYTDDPTNTTYDTLIRDPFKASTEAGYLSATYTSLLLHFNGSVTEDAGEGWKFIRLLNEDLAPFEAEVDVLNPFNYTLDEALISALLQKLSPASSVVYANFDKELFY